MFQLKRIYGGHKAAITSIAITADGSKVATGDASGWLIIRDVSSKLILKKFQPHTSAISKLKFTADGKYLVTASSDNYAKVLNVASDYAPKVTFINHASAVSLMDISPDSTRCITFGADGQLRYWNIENGAELWALSAAGITSLAFSPDGLKIALGNASNYATVIFSTTKALYRTFTGKHTSPISEVLWNADGTKLYTGAGDACIYTWDVLNESWVSSEIYSGHTTAIKSMDISSDGKKIFSSTVTGEIKLWSTEDKKFVRDMNNHGANSVNCVRFMPDGNKAFTCSDDKYLIYVDTSTGSEIANFSGHTNNITRLCINPAKTVAVSASEDKTVKLWDIETGSTLKTLAYHTAAVYGVDFSASGTKIATASEDKKVVIWNATTGEVSQVLQGHSAGVIAVKFSPDGLYLYSCSRDKTIKKWDVSTGAILATYSGHTNEIYSIDISFDGSKLVSMSQDNSVKIWDTTTNSIISTIANAFSSGGYTIRFSPDASTVAVGSYDYMVRVFKVSNTTLLFSSNLGYSAQSVAYSEDGKLLYSCDTNKNIKIFDISNPDSAKWALKSTIPNAHTTTINDIYVRGTTMVSGGNDFCVKFWDMSSETPLLNLGGHTGTVNKLCLISDGTRIVSGGYDGFIYVWDTVNGNVYQTLNVGSRICQIKLNSDKTKLAISDSNGTVYIYSITAGLLTLLTSKQLNTPYENNIETNFDWNDSGTKIVYFGSVASNNNGGGGAFIGIFNVSDLSSVSSWTVPVNISGRSHMNRAGGIMFSKNEDTIYFSVHRTCTTDWTVSILGKLEISTGISTAICESYFDYNNGPRNDVICELTYNKDKTRILWHACYMYPTMLLDGPNYNSSFSKIIKLFDKDLNLISGLEDCFKSITPGAKFLSNGDFIVSSYEGSISWFNSSGTLKTSLSKVIANPSYTVEVSSDEKNIYLGYKNKVIATVNVEGMYSANILPVTSNAYAAAAYDNNTKCVIAYKNGLVKWLDLENKNTIFEFVSTTIFESAVFNPSETLLFLGGTNGVLYVYDNITKSLVKTIVTGGTRLKAIDVSLDGKYVLTGCWSGSGSTVYLKSYDISNNFSIVIDKSYVMDWAYITSIYFSFDNKYIYTSSSVFLESNFNGDKLMKIRISDWTFTEIEKLNWADHASYAGFEHYYKLAASPDRKTFIWYCYSLNRTIQLAGDGLRIYNEYLETSDVMTSDLANTYNKGNCTMWMYSGAGFASNMEFSKDGKKLFVMDWDLNFSVIDMVSRERKFKMKTGQSDICAKIIPSADGSYFYSLGDGTDKSIIKVTDFTDSNIQKLEQDSYGKSFARDISFIGNDAYYAAGYHDGTTIIYDANTDEVVGKYKDGFPVLQIKRSSDPNYFYVCNIFCVKKIKISDLSVAWSWKSPGLINCTKDSWSYGAFCMAPDEKSFLVTIINGLNKVDVSTMTYTSITFSNASIYYRSIDIDKTGTFALIRMSDGYIRKYRYADLVEMKNVMYKGAGWQSMGIQISNDGSFFVINATNIGSVSWTVDSGAEITKISTSDLSVIKTQLCYRSHGFIESLFVCFDAGRQDAVNPMYAFSMNNVDNSDIYFASGQAAVYRLMTNEMSLIEKNKPTQMSTSLSFVSISHASNSDKVIALRYTGMIARYNKHNITKDSIKRYLSSEKLVHTNKVSPDGKFLLLVSDKNNSFADSVNTINIINTATGNIIKTWDETKTFDTGYYYSGNIWQNNYIFTADSSKLFIMAAGIVKIFSTTDFSQIGSITPSGTTSRSISVSEDGAYVTFYGVDGQPVKVYRVSDSVNTVTSAVTGANKIAITLGRLKRLYHFTDVNNATARNMKIYDLDSGSLINTVNLVSSLPQTGGYFHGYTGSAESLRRFLSHTSVHPTLNMFALNTYGDGTEQYKYKIIFFNVTESSVSVNKIVSLPINTASDMVDRIEFSENGDYLYVFHESMAITRIKTETLTVENYRYAPNSWMLGDVFGTCYRAKHVDMSGNVYITYYNGSTIKITKPMLMEPIDSSCTTMRSKYIDGVTSIPYMGMGSNREISINPSKTKIAVVGHEGMIEIYDASTMKVIKVLDAGSGMPLRSIKFSPDGKYFATSGDLNKISIFDANNYSLVKEFSTIHCYCLDWSSDNKYIAIGGSSSTIDLYNVSDYTLYKSLTGHTNMVTFIKFNSDGSKLISCSLDNAVKIWEVSTGYVLKNLTGHSGGTFSADFGLNDAEIITGDGNGNIRVWTYSSGVQKSITTVENDIVYVSYTENKNYILTCSRKSGYVRAYTLDMTKAIVQYYTYSLSAACIKGVAGTDDILLTGSTADYSSYEPSYIGTNNSISNGHNGRINVFWHKNPFQTSAKKEVFAQNHFLKINNVFVGPTRTFTVAMDSVLKIWDNSNLSSVNVDLSVYGIPYSVYNDGNNTFVGMDSGKIVVLDNAGNIINSYPIFSCIIKHIDYANGKLLLSTDAGKIFIVDKSNVTVTKTINLSHSKALFDVNANNIFVANANKITFYTVSNDSSSDLTVMPSGTINNITKTTDCNYITVSGSDKYVYVVSVVSKSVSFNISTHKDEVVTAIRSDDGNYVFSCGKDNDIHILSTATRSVKKFLKPHTGYADIIKMFGNDKILTCGNTDFKIAINDIASVVKTAEFKKIDATEITHIIPTKGLDYFYACTSSGYILKLYKSNAVIKSQIQVSSIESVTYISVDNSDNICYTTPTKVGIVAASTMILQQEKTHTCIKAFPSLTAGNIYAIYSDGTLKEIKMSDLSTVKSISAATAATISSADIDYINGRIFIGLTTGYLKAFKLSDFVSAFNNQLHTSTINNVIYKDGKIYTMSNDKTVKIYDSTTMQLQNIFSGHTDIVKFGDLSDDGTKFATASNDDTIRIWEINRSILLKTLFTHTGFDVNFVVWQNSSNVLSFSSDKTCFSNDAAHAILKNVSFGHLAAVKALAMSPDKTRLVSGDDSGTINFWDLKNKTIKKSFSAHTGIIRYADYSMDGTKFVTCGDDKKLNIWRTSDITNMFSITAHTNKVYKSKVYANDKVVTCSNDASDRTIKVWDLALGTLIQTFNTGLDVLDAEFNPAGDIIAELNNTRIQLWNWVNKTSITNWATGTAQHLTWTKDGIYIVVGHSDGYVSVWQASDGSQFKLFRPTTSAINSVYCTNDKKIVVSSADKNIYVYNMDFTLIKTISKHQAAVNRINVSQTNDIIVSVSDDMSVRAFDFNSGNILWISRIPPMSYLRQLMFNNEENTLIASDESTSVSSWDIATGTQLNYIYQLGSRSTTAGEGYILSAIDYSPDQTKLLVSKYSSYAGLFLYDAKTFDLITQFTTTNYGTIVKSKFIKNGQYIGVLDYYGRFGIHQQDTPGLIREFTTQDGNSDFVTNAACTKIYIYNSVTKKIKSYDFLTGLEIASYTTNLTVTSEMNKCLDISKDGTMLMVTDVNGKINLFSESTTALLKSYQIASVAGVKRVKFNDSANRIFASTNSGFKIIDTTTWTEISTIDPSYNISDFAINSEVSKLYLGTSSGDIRAYEDPDIAPPGMPLGVHTTLIKDTRFTTSWDLYETVDGFECQYKPVSSQNWIDLPNVTTKECVVSGLIQFTDYEFRLRSFKNTIAGVKRSGYTNSVTLKTEITVPQNVKTSVDNVTINVSWDANAIAESYMVYSKASGGDYDSGTNVASNKFSLIGINATAYYFKVTTLAGLIESGTSQEAMAITAPLAPTGLKVIQYGSSAVLSWKSSASSTSYIIEQRMNNEQFEVVAEVSNTSATIPGVGGGNTFTYRIKSKNASGTSIGYSSLVSLKTTPNAPSGLMARGSDQRVILSWDDAFGVAGYSVYMRSGSMPFVEIANGITAAKYIINNLSNGATYDFKVKAKNDMGESDFSSEISCVPRLFVMPDMASYSFMDRFSTGTKDYSSTRLSRYKFTVTQDSDEFENYISIILSGTTIDAFLYLLDKDGNVVFKNDDSNVYTGESKIVEILNSGEYTVVCATFRDDESIDDVFNITIKGRFVSDVIKLEGYGNIDIPSESPYGLKVENIPVGKVYISWKPVYMATEYVVYKKDSTGNLIEIGTTNKNGIIYSVDITKEYKFYVKASNSVGDSAVSEPFIYPEPTIIIPDVVLGLNITQINSKEIDISWQPASNATGYLVLVKDGNNFVKVPNMQNPYAGTSVRLSNVQPEKCYTFCIKSVNMFGYSDSSEEINFVPSKTKVNTISSLRILKNEGSLKLYWNGNSEMYNVMIKKDNERFVLLDKTTNLEYTVDNLEVGCKYQFGVFASNSVGDISETKYISIDYLPARPDYVHADYHSGTLKITWQHSKNADFYRIYKKVGSYSYLLNPEEKITTNSFYANVKDGNLYKYVVRACNEFGESEDSKEAEVGN